MENHNFIEQTARQESILETTLSLELQLRMNLLCEAITKNGLEGSIVGITDWTKEAEQWATDNRRMAILNFSRNSFYKAAGDKRGAKESIIDAVSMARQEGYDDLAALFETSLVV